MNIGAQESTENRRNNISSATRMPTADKQYAIVTHETIDIQITKNITSITAIIKSMFLIVSQPITQYGNR
jgi:hypothetical protein